jgi:predicted lipoprotein with Yx(FWY)xxD motif
MMVVLRAPKLSAIAGAVVVAAIVAGCGSSNSSSSASNGAAASPSASSSASSAPGVSVASAKGPDGTYLVGASGRALYLWVADSGGQSNCSGACTKVWPPLLTTGTPAASGGVSATDLGTVTRSDGGKQVTYKGHPLYYFAADHAAGATTGQGSNSFGAKWWLVAPSGTAITRTGSSSAASSNAKSSGSASGGGVYGGSSSGGSSSGGSSGGGSGWG